jgi:putative ABC transport system permease protein
MPLWEALRFAWNALKANRVRTLLTALGLIIGNASVILVVTISLTGKDYILDQIRGIGSNLIFAAYTTNNKSAPEVAGDFVKWADVEAARRELDGRILAATGVSSLDDSVILEGKQRGIRINGVDESYSKVRNLAIPAGRTLDAVDIRAAEKVAVLTETLAGKLYGSQSAALGQVIKLQGLRFTVVGTFRERTSTFGQSEVDDYTVLIPYTILRNFQSVERVDPMYVQALRAEEVEQVTAAVRQVLESRHRRGATYDVRNLNAILEAAEQISLILSLVLMVVSALALLISGIGIMNIMLVTVTERTREIGVRMAIGAGRRAVLQQFLTEAVLISLVGGGIGVLVGISLPLGVNAALPEARVPISGLSILVAFFVSFGVGLVFGLLPAMRAARLNPTEALRYE